MTLCVEHLPTLMSQKGLCTKLVNVTICKYTYSLDCESGHHQHGSCYLTKHTSADILMLELIRRPMQPRGWLICTLGKQLLYSAAVMVRTWCM